MELYIVRVADDFGVYEYEHGNLKHAKEHFDMEKTAQLIEYQGVNKYLVLFTKIAKDATLETERNFINIPIGQIN